MPRCGMGSGRTSWRHCSKATRVSSASRAVDSGPGTSQTNAQRMGETAPAPAPGVAVTFPVERDDRALFEGILGRVATLHFLNELSEDDRRVAIQGVRAAIVWNWRRELGPEERS